MLDEVLTGLATAAGTAIVSAATTDLWTRVKAGITGLATQGDPGSTATVDQRLERTRAELLSAPRERLDQVRHEQAARWACRLEDLLTERPAMATELQRLLDSVAEVTGSPDGPALRQHVTGYGHAWQAVQGSGQQTNVFGPWRPQ